MGTLEDLRGLLDLNVLSTRGEVKLAPEPDFSACKPVKLADGTFSGIKDHVKIGVRALIANPYFMLADEMGAMKSAQVIIAAQFLYQARVIDRVLVVTPPSVRHVWFDKDLGELSLHLWDTIAARVSEFHNPIRQWDHGDWSTSKDRQLRWIITNYEFFGRSKERTKTLLAYCGPKTLLVLDESSAIANKQSLQSRATLVLRKNCGRVVELNGTPIVDGPISLLNQANTLHYSILECPYITQFRERYCVMTPGVDYPAIEGYKNLEDIQRRLAPYVLRRLKEQCLDLPPKLPAAQIYVPLKESWPHYKAMKNDMATWLTSTDASIAGQAMEKAMRLAQLTSGFIGGVENVTEELIDDVPEFMRNEDWFLDEPVSLADIKRALPRLPTPHVQEVGREKLDALLDFYAKHLDEDSAFKLMVWCRFKPELHRLLNEFAKRFPNVRLGAIEGGQKKIDRNLALRLLHPRTAIMSEPALLASIIGSGSMGHNFTAAHVAVNLSYDYSLFKYNQGSARIHRPGQTKPVSYYDMVATGPDGQKTIDHAILKARKFKDDMAQWTAAAWLDTLRAA